MLSYHAFRTVLQRFASRSREVQTAFVVPTQHGKRTLERVGSRFRPPTGGSDDKYSWGIADADQLAAPTKLIDDHSKEMGIKGDKAARDRLAARVMDLFNGGFTNPEDIRRHLDSSRASL